MYADYRPKGTELTARFANTRRDFLAVNRFQHLGAAYNRFLGERLTLPQLGQDVGLLEFLLVLLEGLVDAFAIFGIDD